MKRTFILFAIALMALSCANRTSTSVRHRSVAKKTYHPGDSIPAGYLRNHSIDSFFTCQPIPDTIFELMQGRTYKSDCPIPRDSLRYITCLHCDIGGTTYVGEMVLSVSIADTVLSIFRQLYEAHYPIEKMRLADYWNAEDEPMMRSNNTSAFNYRCKTGQNKISKHGLGLAIDINPLYNPYFRHTSDSIGIRYETIEPSTARPYIDRAADFPYKIVAGDICHRLFISHGFTWGGAWHTIKDYQHFEL